VANENGGTSIEKVFPLPALNTELALKVIIRSLRDSVLKTGISRVIIGLSGGIDSALSLFLAVKAFGKTNVTAVYLPYKSSSPQSHKDAMTAAETVGVDLQVDEITPAADAIMERDREITPLRRGNIMARLRMIYLYDLSAKYSAMVVGTSNKTELLIGYSTLWGDMASGVNPIGDLYKFQVFELARGIGVPAALIEKPPTADLWEGQTDENEIGLSYDFLDRVLYHWIERNWPHEKLVYEAAKSGVSGEKIEKVISMVRRSQYKRKMPVIVKVSEKTIDREFRYPRDWGC